jgi:very-short-patch-repair endonuclease
MRFQKGQHPNPSTEFKKGHVTKHKSDYGIRTSQRLMGHKVSEATREKLRKANLGLKHSPMSEENKRKASERMKGNKNPLGTKRSDEFKRQRSEWMKGNTRWKLAKGKFFDTIPELLIEAELKKRGINYIKQAYISGFSVDFYLPETRTIIECDGDYWHNLPEVKIKDLKKNSVWEFNGFKVFRFWEHEIKKSSADCVSRIGLFE